MKNGLMWFAMTFAFSANASAADIPLLKFCLEEAPNVDSLRELHAKECPGVIALAAQQGQDAVSAARAKDKADAQKAMLDNLAAALPKSGEAKSESAQPIDDLKHVAEYAEAKLLVEAGKKIHGEIVGRFSGRQNTVRVISASDLDGLRKSTLTPTMVSAEIDDLNTIVKKASNSCPRKNAIRQAPIDAGAMLFSGAISDGGLLKLNAIFDMALKISQAFQTNLGDTVSGSLQQQSFGIVMHGFLAGRDVNSQNSMKFFVGLPVVTGDNQLATKLKDLRNEISVLIDLISKADEKSECSIGGKAAIEAVKARMQSLNSAPDAATPSYLLTAMRIEEITKEVAIKEGGKAVPQTLLAIEKFQSGSTLLATKSAFRSQRYTRLVTVTVAYRLETYEGESLGAGTILLPDNDSMAQIERFDKTFATQGPLRSDGGAAKP